MWCMFVKLFLSSLETRTLMLLHERHTFLLKWGVAVKEASYYLYFIFKLKKWSEVKVTQSCLTLCDPMDCSLPGSPLHGILQPRVLEWVAISFSKWDLFIYLLYIVVCIFWDSQVVLVVKNPPASRRYKRHGFNPWVRKIPWKKLWQPTPVFLPRESHERTSLAGYGP